MKFNKNMRFFKFQYRRRAPKYQFASLRMTFNLHFNKRLHVVQKGIAFNLYHNSKLMLAVCHLTGIIFLIHVAATPSGRRPPYRGFTITLRHTTLGRTPLDE